MRVKNIFTKVMMSVLTFTMLLGNVSVALADEPSSESKRKLVVSSIGYDSVKVQR